MGDIGIGRALEVRRHLRHPVDPCRRRPKPEYLRRRHHPAGGPAVYRQRGQTRRRMSATWWTPAARKTTTPGRFMPRTCTTPASAFTRCAAITRPPMARTLDSGADYRHAYPQIVPGPRRRRSTTTPRADITDSADSAGRPDPTTQSAGSKDSPRPSEWARNFSAPDGRQCRHRRRVVRVRLQECDVYAARPVQISRQLHQLYPRAAGRGSTTRFPAGRPTPTRLSSPTRTSWAATTRTTCSAGTPTAAIPGTAMALIPAPSIRHRPGGYRWRPSRPRRTPSSASMQANGVRYVISGHDHHHYNSVVTSPDQQQPGAPAHHRSPTVPSSTPPARPSRANDVPVEQDLDRIGYYIFTVDGPRVTIDYYADDHGTDWTAHRSVNDPRPPLREAVHHGLQPERQREACRRRAHPTP